MGCDYYIDIYLEVELSDGSVQSLKVETQRGYFPEPCSPLYDSDDDPGDVEAMKEAHRSLQQRVEELCLTLRPPVVVYECGEFRTDQMREKYLPLLQRKHIPRPGLVRITKKERRYE